jgi:hypothetical protein
MTVVVEKGSKGDVFACNCRLSTRGMQQVMMTTQVA